MEDLHKLIDYIQAWIALVPPAGWYVLGSLLAASGLLVGIVAWIKRRHLKKTLDKLEDWFINMNLWFFSTVLTFGSFVIGMAAFGFNQSDLLPYLGNHASSVFAFAVTFYTFSKLAKKKLEERKARKLLLSSQIPAVIREAATILSDPKPETPITSDMWQS